MNTLLKKLRRLLLYGGLEREQYKTISSEIDEANRKSIVILSFACLIVYAIRLCLRYSKVPDTNRTVFLCAIVLFGLLAVGNTLLQHNRQMIHLSAYLFMAFYLGVGILAAVGEGSIQERTTLYLVFIVVAPMLFALNAAELAIIVIPAELIYLAFIGRFQSSYPVYATNKGNSLFFAASGLLLGIYMANMKISGIYNAHVNASVEEIQQLNQELAASKTSLQAALSSAEQANRAKTTFLNSMSHDIRTPMNAIIGFTSLAQNHITDTAQVQDYLGKIMTSSQHLLALINDVLDMSRIESGKVTLSMEPLSLPKLIEDIRTITQASIQEKRLNFSVDLTRLTNEIIVGDSLRLQQILLNIIGNAIKFTPAFGDIALTIRQLPDAPEGCADYRFQVKDSGIGMSSEFQKHIFEAFSRDSSAAVCGIQGTGLGMAITKNLVDLMHGSIAVESTEGVGTEFTVSLRFAVGAEPVTYDDSPAIAFSGQHILLAEDNALNAEIASTILTEHGFLVDVVPNGEEALNALLHTSAPGYDLILMDIQMPKMDGYEATRRIRALPDSTLASIPIIAMTANAFEEDRRAALAAGMNGHIAKPIELDKLMEVLGQVLREA